MADEKKKILIIDDDNVLRSMYKQKLISDGYDVSGASDGEEAMDLYNSEDFDLVITDIMLPRMSGNEILKKIMTTEKGKTIPVIAWSNLPKDDDKNQALELGAKEYLEKGKLTLEDVTDTVNKYLK